MKSSGVRGVLKGLLIMLLYAATFCWKQRADDVVCIVMSVYAGLLKIKYFVFD